MHVHYVTSVLTFFLKYTYFQRCSSFFVPHLTHALTYWHSVFCYPPPFQHKLPVHSATPGTSVNVHLNHSCGSMCENWNCSLKQLFISTTVKTISVQTPWSWTILWSLFQFSSMDNYLSSPQPKLTCHHAIPSCSPYESVLGGGLLGASQDADVTDGCLCRVPWNKLDAKSPLPEGLLLYGTHKR